MKLKELEKIIKELKEDQLNFDQNCDIDNAEVELYAYTLDGIRRLKIEENRISFNHKEQIILIACCE